MIRRILNNIKHDISGNFNLIMQNAGTYKAMLYLSRAGFMLCKAVIFNKRKEFHNIEFYDIW